MTSLHIRTLVLAALAIAPFGFTHAQVTPPPLPIGSAQVVPQPGVDPVEKKRYVRAHHAKGVKRDPQKDDSEPANNGNANGPGSNSAGGNGNGNANGTTK